MKLLLRYWKSNCITVICNLRYVIAQHYLDSENDDKIISMICIYDFDYTQTCELLQPVDNDDWIRVRENHLFTLTYLFQHYHIIIIIIFNGQKKDTISIDDQWLYIYIT